MKRGSPVSTVKVAEDVEKELEEDRRRLEQMVALVEAQDRMELEEREKCLQENIV